MFALFAGDHLQLMILYFALPSHTTQLDRELHRTIIGALLHPVARMQGFNMGRYVPPEHEGTISANRLVGKHALGSRARKIGSGILTVRFEMPYAVWCNSCPKPTIIGQGVRFNAEKKKVGNYHSTPIYAFRMKHVACGGWLEIRTDPQNTRYVVTEGGKARDTGEDKVREGEEGLEILTTEERERRRADAFAQLEGKVEEKVVEKDNKRRIAELLEERERHWEDPYEASRRLRKGFRIERKVRAKDEKITEEIKDRMGLGFDLLPESEEDRQRAAYIEFGALGDEDGKAITKPLFMAEKTSNKTSLAAKAGSKNKAALAAERKRQMLQQELTGNTRAALNPFGLDVDLKDTARAVNGIKRRRAVEPPRNQEATNTTTSGDGPSLKLPSEDGGNTRASLLVAYDSDEE